MAGTAACRGAARFVVEELSVAKPKLEGIFSGIAIFGGKPFPGGEFRRIEVEAHGLGVV